MFSDALVSISSTQIKSTAAEDKCCGLLLAHFTLALLALQHLDS